MAHIKRHGDSMDSGGMVMDSSELTPASEMAMVFFNSMITPLWSMAWAPNSTHAYAGTCIFLIFLSVIQQALMAFRSIAFTHNRNLEARIPSSGDKESLMEERIRPPHVGSIRRMLRESWARHPFLSTVEIGRSLLNVVIGGVGYLLMVAVMTLNVGYFLSVLAGIFLGTLLFGRLGADNGH
ncbi:Ctr copper transporter [Xylaria sp. FL0043]|nr:Ctr copper transporter [Xylaria sp. FL0043]